MGATSGETLRIHTLNGTLRHEFRNLNIYTWESSSDGSLIAIGVSSDKNVLIWDVQRERLRYRLPGHRGGVHGLAFSPTDSIVAVACTNRSIMLWDIVGGQQRAQFVGQRETSPSVAFSPDGQTLASVSRTQGVNLWHIPTGISMGFVGPADVNRIAFTARSRHLICLFKGHRVASLNAGSVP